MLRTLVVLVVLAGASLAAGPAGATTLKPERVARDATWLGQAGATMVAFRAPADGRAAVTLSDAGRRATVPAPAGCTATAAGGGRIAYGCGAVTQDDPVFETQHLAVTSLTGGGVVRLERRLQGSATDGPGPPNAVGAQWIRTSSGGYHGPFTSYVNWRTGQEGSSPLDPARVLDLDAPGLSTPLCSPLRAVRDETDATQEPSMLPVTVRGGWVLIVTTAGAELHRCGSAAPVPMPRPFGADPEFHPVLGDGWVAQEVFRGGAGQAVELLRLSDRRRFTVPTTAGIAALTRRRLYLSPLTAGHGAITMVSLPSRKR